MKRAFLFLLSAAVCVFVYVFLISLMRGSPYDVGSVAAAFILAAGLCVLNGRFFRSEGESLAAIGFDAPARRFRQFGVAFLAGCAVVVVWTLIFWLSLSPRWQPYEGFEARGAVSRVAFCLFNNAAEELAYRAYLIWKLAQRFGPIAAVVSTSALFTVLHVQAGVPWVSAATVVFTSGILYAALFLRWRSLPLVVGFHVANNVMQELVGLRLTSLSVLQPTFADGATPGQPAAVLVLAALFNLAIAWSVSRNQVSLKARV